MNGETPSSEPLWPPATFLERGLAVPFTMPTLAGTRVRLGSRRMELVVPHPAGTRGVFILPWSEINQAHAPTVHDTLLIERLAPLTSLAPGDIRQAARSVAREGMAGHGAREAVLVAEAQDRRQLLLTSGVLMQTLVEQIDGALCEAAELRRRGRDAIQRLVPSIGCTADAITLSLERLATVYGEIGLGEAAQTARSRQVLLAMDSLCADLLAWKGRGTGGAAASLAADLVLSAAQTTMLLTQHAIAEATARVAALPALLATMVSGPSAASALRELGRPEWLLDGWAHICAVWVLAVEAGSCHAGLSEMALMVPVMPTETDGWGGAPVDETERQRLRRRIRSQEEWRAGSAAINLVSRNERIRAMAA